MIPRSFQTLRSGVPESVPLTTRDGIDMAAARPLVRRLGELDWESYRHAYGPAGDVPGQLAAVVLGDEPTRAEAWWNLWGNIYHQGDIYEATLAAVPILIAVAGWRDHPDRAQAIIFLREVAHAERLVGPDSPSSHGSFAALREALVAGTRHLTARWRTEPLGVQRALVWLLSTVPEVRVVHHDLIDALLPPRHRSAWDSVLAGYPDSQEEFDAVDALEEWVANGD